MRDSKRRYYDSPDRQRQLRLLDEQSLRMFSRQQDMESFLSALAPRFKGVYFVDLDRDTIRYLFIPPYFESILAEKDGKFSKGLLRYAEELAAPEFYEDFTLLCDYDSLRRQLNQGETPSLLYRKKDGSILQLQVTRTENPRQQETLWIFADVQTSDGEN